MKQKFPALILLILFFANNHVNAQFRHYPHGHEFLMEKELSFYKVKFDTIVSDEQYHALPFPGRVYTINKLWHYASIPCEDNILTNQYGCLEEDYFTDSAFMGMFAGGGEYFYFSRHIRVGEIFHMRSDFYTIDSLVYLKDTFYVLNDIVDSAAVLYAYENGKIDFSQEPALLGHNLGWLDQGFLSPYAYPHKQHSRLTNGVPNFYPTMDWRMFFPERAGDYKIWKTHYNTHFLSTDDLKDSTILRLDSFLSVSVYSDSIVQVILRRKQRPNYTWMPPDTITTTVTSSHPMAQYFTPSKICSYYQLYNKSNGYSNFRTTEWMIHDINGWPYAFEFRITQPRIRVGENPCEEISYSEIPYIHEFNELFGSHRVYTSYPSVIVEQFCIAYKIGSNTYGSYTILGGYDLPKQLLHVYHNPSSSVLNMDAIYSGSNYEIIDLAGATLLSGTLSENSIAVDGLADGTYFLRVLQHNGSVVSGKFVKGAF